MINPVRLVHSSPMAEYIDFLGQQIKVKRRAFQKRLGVSVYPNGEIRVSANKTTRQKEILRFLQSQQAWLEKALIESQEFREKYPPKFFRSGENYPYLGRHYRLQILKGEKVSLRFHEDEIFFVSPISEEDWSDELRISYNKAFKTSYRQVAEKLMTQRMKFWSETMKLYPKAVQFRDQRSIWGSCSPENKISLNFKLIVAPLFVIDYVLIHELAHIKHKDHSKNFWKLVEQYTKKRQEAKIWLKQHQYETDFLSKKSDLN